VATQLPKGAVESAGLSQTLGVGLADITVFVPINNTFNVISSVVSSADQAALISVLQYHVIPGIIAYPTLLGNVTAPSLECPV
jgi:uncharacterized surface protein with fasciclin (FAS1) repeats